MNQGAEKLRASGFGLGKIRDLLGQAGIQVAHNSIKKWRLGSSRPTLPARQALAVPPFEIPVDAWDIGLDGVKRESPALPQVPSPPAARRTARPASETPTAEELAKEYLDRCSAFREAAEKPSITDAARSKYLQLEARAIQLYAKISGQSEATENQLVRSPQWSRLRAEIFRALEAHPQAAKAVLAVLQEVGRAHAA